MNTTIDFTSKRFLLSTLVLVPSCAYMKQVDISLFLQVHATTLVSLALFTLISIEILFYIQFIQQKQKFQAITKPQTPLSPSQRKALFWNCVHTIKDVSTWGEGWFYYKKDNRHPSFKDIKRDNMALWFAWAFWHEHLDIVVQNQAWVDEIEWMLTAAEHHYGVQFPPGFNPELVCIRLNLDPVEAYHRPLLLYMCLYTVTKLFDFFYLKLYWQFEASPAAPGIVWGGILDTPSTSQHRVSYIYRPLQSKRVPIVFIHGIGAGVIFYAEFIHRLCKLNRPIFLVQLPYVAMHMVDQVPTAQETVSEIADMLHTHGFQKAVFVSHSLGTGVTSWIMNKKPSMMAGLVMIDPICFLLHYHNVAFNFVHHLPTTLFEYVMHYCAARELYTSNYISRHFHWFETIYFIKSNDKNLQNAVIFLSEKDSIVGSQDVYNYLKGQNVHVYMMKGLEHALFLFNGKWKKAILEHIEHIALKADE